MFTWLHIIIERDFDMLKTLLKAERSTNEQQLKEATVRAKHLKRGSSRSVLG